MITYNDIYEAARKERYSEQLQSLPKEFVKEVSQYLKEKKEVAGKDEEAFSEVILKTKKQLENAVTLFKELMLRRRKKILDLVLVAGETGISKQDFENMLDFEKEFFDKVMNYIEKLNQKLELDLNGKKLEDIVTKVCFKEDVGAFIGFDGKECGPYKKEQIVTLPNAVANILIDEKKAEMVKE